MTSPLDTEDVYDDVPVVDDAEPEDADVDHDGPGAAEEE